MGFRPRLQPFITERKKALISPNSIQQDHRINDRIRAREVRLIDPAGQQLGVVPLPRALATARELGLDLVEVASEANPPVCRIMDYGKYRFDLATKARETRRRSHQTELKSMRYSVRIGPGDFDTKTRKVAKFLDDGHKVRVVVRFRRGREQSRPEFGRRLLDRIVENVAPVKVESAPRLDGTQMTMLLAPDPDRRRGG